MTIDFTQVHSIFLLVLPALVGVVAGLIRQDKFPKPVNEVIFLVLVGVIAFIQALLDGKIGASPLADFMILVTYCTAAVKLTPINDLMKSVQTSTSIGGKAPSVAPAPPFDLGALANQIAPFLAQELVKLRLASNVPVVQPQAAQSVQQQQPISFSAQAQQPQNFNPNATQIYGMNSGVPGTASPQPQTLTDLGQVYNLQTQQTQAVPGQPQQPLPQGWQQVVPPTRQGG